MATENEHRRLAVLRHLADCSEYTSNASILREVVRGVGIPTSNDQMITTLSWLKEQELIEMVDHGHVVIATAKTRGVDVAQGSATVPGVARPSARG